VDFREDLDDRNPVRHRSLYICSTGILPEFQGKGRGNLFKCWQVAYAPHHGFNRIVTNHRKSNRRIIKLNESFGFKIVRTNAETTTKLPRNKRSLWS
jgi:ribosomal protein S18 acetylase RimI-like enzyme